MKLATMIEEDAKIDDLEGPDWNPVERAIFFRRSVRRYRQDQVPERLVRRVLEAGRFAPSSGNTQPWKAIVIRDSEILEEMERDLLKRLKLFDLLLDFRKPGLIGRLAWLNARVMVRLMPNRLHPECLAAMNLISRGKAGIFHGAPTVILLLKDRRGPTDPSVDLGIYGQTMVLAAQSLDLGSCWLSVVSTLTWGRKWKRRLEIEYPYELVSAIGLGYPDGNPMGMVSRETRQIAWHEGGSKKVIY